MKYTTTGLINAIKRNASIPTSQVKFSTDDFLKFLNEELELTIVGELLTLKSDYFIFTTDVSLVANTSEYAIPTYAIGWKLNTVGYVDSSGIYQKLPMITREQRDYYTSISTSSSPSAYYISGNNINIVPDAGSTVTGSLRYDLIRLQNELVATSACGLISVVTDPGTAYSMTVDSSPVSSGAYVDVISGTNPFNIIARNVLASVAGTIVTVTYGTSFVRAPVAGDYIAATGYTPIPNIPEEYHAILAQAAVARCLISMNDTKGLQTAALALTNMLDKMRQRSMKRVNDSPKKIIGRNTIINILRRG